MALFETYSSFWDLQLAFYEILKIDIKLFLISRDTFWKKILHSLFRFWLWRNLETSLCRLSLILQFKCHSKSWDLFFTKNWLWLKLAKIIKLNVEKNYFSYHVPFPAYSIVLTSGIKPLHCRFKHLEIVFAKRRWYWS